MSSQDALNFALQQFHIYFGLPIFILGVIGGTLNIIIFTTLKTFRETSSAFYLTTVSAVNIGQVLLGLFVQILSAGFQTDIRKTSWICKAQIYTTAWCILVSRTGMCLATIDQFLSMSKYRRFSNLRFAQRSILITCIFWSLYCISDLFVWDASSGTCQIIDSTYALYATRFYVPVVLGFLPMSTMITFSVLAYYNTRTIVSRQVNIVRLSRDRQLTAMTLVHVVFVIIITIPYLIFAVYSVSPTYRDPQQIARNNFIYAIILLITYLNVAAPFYIYCCVSERFRKQLRYVLTKICTNRWRINLHNIGHNQIVPSVETILADETLRPKRVSIELVSIQ